MISIRHSFVSTDSFLEFKGERKKPRVILNLNLELFSSYLTMCEIFIMMDYLKQLI